MRIITRQSLANQAAERWKSQYLYGETDWGVCQGNSEVIYNNLIKLGATPTPEDVNEVIGNISWTRVPSCEECDGQCTNEEDWVIVVGGGFNCDSSPTYICGNCFDEILKEVSTYRNENE